MRWVLGLGLLGVVVCASPAFSQAQDLDEADAWAYAMAHDAYYGSTIRQGVIMICTPDLYYQEFKFDGEMMRKYRHQFLQRLSQFYGRNVA